MRARFLAFLAFSLAAGSSAPANMLYEATSPYHHIRVFEENGMRTLYFDDARESRSSVREPWKGHFEYTEYFHMAWLWNTNLSQVLFVGLGGGTAQCAFEHYYPEVRLMTAEIDPAVVRVARDFFGFHESERQKVATEDGRLFLRRSTARYDLIILDAYVQGRYGSSIPQHLATKEFFQIARSHLATNGVVAYNVIGSLGGWRSDIGGAIYRTLKAVFPQVYFFPAATSQNVVLVATQAAAPADLASLRQQASRLLQDQRVTLPRFNELLERFQTVPPASAPQSPILTDDYAPVEGLSAQGR
jgi:spermidine synthase